MMDLPSTLLLSPAFPNRPVDARWLRVLDLAARGRSRARHRYDDDWVRAGLRYLARLNRCNDEDARRCLNEAFPDVDAACRLHQGDRVTRGVVEARLLAGQSPAEVAAVEGLTPGAVEAYEALFFQVVGRREAKSFILIEAIGGRLWDGKLTEENADVLLKLFGYLKGPLFLEAFVRYFRLGLRFPEDPASATLQELDELATMLQVRAVVQARVLPFPHCVRVLRLWQLSCELRAFAAGVPVGAMSPLTTVDVPRDARQMSAAPTPSDSAWWSEVRATAGAA